MLRRIIIRAQRDPSRAGFALWGWIDYPGGHPRQVITELVMDQRREMETFEPFLVLEPAKAQQLLDDLWNEGLRPTEAQATTEHLNDLRKVAFTLLRCVASKWNND